MLRFSAVCEDLKAPVNGEIVLSGNSPGSTASYSCNEGFELAGPETRTCQQNVQWSGDPPFCNETCDTCTACKYYFLSCYNT